MMIYEQKILRFDIDPIIYEIMDFTIKENIVLTYEVRSHAKDFDHKILTLIWKIHYLKDEEQEVIGLLITDDCKLDMADLNIYTLIKLIHLSRMNAKKLITDKVHRDFLFNSGFDVLDISDFAKQVLKGILYN